MFWSFQTKFLHIAPFEQRHLSPIPRVCAHTRPTKLILILRACNLRGNVTLNTLIKYKSLSGWANAFLPLSEDGTFCHSVIKWSLYKNVHKPQYGTAKSDS